MGNRLFRGFGWFMLTLIGVAVLVSASAVIAGLFIAALLEIPR